MFVQRDNAKSSGLYKFFAVLNIGGNGVRQKRYSDFAVLGGSDFVPAPGMRLWIRYRGAP
jgi:hypothetical protein